MKGYALLLILLILPIVTAAPILPAKMCWEFYTVGAVREFCIKGDGVIPHDLWVDGNLNWTGEAFGSSPVKMREGVRINDTGGTGDTLLLNASGQRLCKSSGGSPYTCYTLDELATDSNALINGTDANFVNLEANSYNNTNQTEELFTDSNVKFAKVNSTGLYSYDGTDTGANIYLTNSLWMERYNEDLPGVNIIARRCRGTPSSRDFLNDGDTITAVNAQPCTLTGWGGNDGQYAFYANEDHSGTAQGIKFQLRLTPNGATSMQTVMNVDTVRTEFLNNLEVSGNAIVTKNITSYNVFVPQYMFSHTNATIIVNQGTGTLGNWTNITFSQEDSDVKYGIEHTFNDATNTTFTIMEAGIYEVDYDLDIEDTTSGASSIDVAARLILTNGSEIIGSIFETDITKQDASAELSHDFLIEAFAGEQFVVQFTASNDDVQVSTHGTFGEYPESATLTVKKIANLP